MKQKSEAQEARLRTGLERLKGLGLASGESSVEALARALETDPALDLAIVSRLGEISSDESVALLRQIERASEEKLLRREIRRSLYRLAQRGVATAAAEPAPPDPRPAILPIMAGPEPEGYLSLFDPFGDRLLWILKSRAGALLQLSVVVNEPAGLKEAVLAEVNRKLLRSLRSDLEQRHGLRLVEVDWRYCDWIAADGYERAKARGELREAASSYPQLRLQLFPRPAEPQRSPIESAPEITADEVSLRSSAELFAEKELQFWFLPEEVLSPYLKRYNEMRESPIVLDRFQQASRVNEIVQSALEEVFSGEGASSWRRRLEETAWFFRKTGRAEAARRARAAAEALSQSSSGGRQIPFFEELVRRSFGLFFEREAEKEREEKASSLIVTPDEIRQQRAEAARSGSRLRPK